MKKISKVDAYQGLSEVDFAVMDQELQSIYGSDQRNGRKMTHQFYLDQDNFIVLEVLWDDEVVQTMRFENNGDLTEEGKKVVGRPSLGTTKKVSITLPDEVWERIDEEKENMSMSAFLRFVILQKFS